MASVAYLTDFPISTYKKKSPSNDTNIVFFIIPLKSIRIAHFKYLYLQKFSSFKKINLQKKLKCENYHANYSQYIIDSNEK
jgi:hypothetical protein